MIQRNLAPEAVHHRELARNRACLSLYLYALHVGRLHLATAGDRSHATLAARRQVLVGRLDEDEGPLVRPDGENGTRLRHGGRVDVRHRDPERGGRLGADLVQLREGTRALLKFFPGWGNVMCGLVAGSGTYAIGRAATVFFIDGVSLKDARRTYLISRKKRARLALRAHE